MVERYVIGNKDKTSFLGYDATNSRSKKVDGIGDEDIQIFTLENVNLMLDWHQNTLFYIRNDFKYKYKINISWAD